VQQRFTESNANAMVIMTNSNDTERKRKALLIHRQLGHASAKVIKTMPNHVLDFLTNLKIQDADFKDCDLCIRAKSHRLPHNTEHHRSVRLLELVCSNIMGPHPSDHDDRYIISFIADYSNFAVVFIIRNRSEAVECFAKYHKNAIARHPGTNIVELRCDNAKEYVKGNFKRFCKAAQIDIDSGQSYCPELNGKAERFNRTLTTKVRCLILVSKIPKSKWPEAVTYAVKLINHLPTKSNVDQKTPYKLWHGRKPTVKHIRVFGCVAYQHIPKEVRQRTHDDQKFKARATKMIHVGSSPTGYLLYDPLLDKYQNSRDVVFIET